ncbi:hypothetical protein OH784_25510 [Ectobacillus funiculus]|uniref:hypothetical protein n=1 Tax=Ectobacillus funiculus TaxID=137993 RepID=UPI0039782B71
MNFEKIINNFDIHATGFWYPLSLTIPLLLFVLVMSKRLSWKEIYITFGVVGLLSTITDLIFGANLDFYDLGKPQHEGLVFHLSSR